MKKTALMIAAVWHCIICTSISGYAALPEEDLSVQKADGQETELAETITSKTGWDYRPDVNEWYYYGDDGTLLTGRRKIQENTYFFNENGKMLTGWVQCGDEQGDEARIYEGGDMDDEVHFCTTTGAMAVQSWVFSYAPDEDNPEMGDEGNWYYFDAKGRAYCNERVTYEGQDYLFDENGVRLSGWVYECSEKNGYENTSYIPVDAETAEALSGDLHGDGSYAEGVFAHNPQYYLFCDTESGSVIKSAWVDAVPPGKEDEDTRSYYFDRKGHLVSQYRYGFTRDEGDWGHYPEELHDYVAADRVWPCKIEDEHMGTYSYQGAPGSQTEDVGFEGFIMKAEDGRYYLCENNGARLDGLFLIRKKAESSKTQFPNGIYDFSDRSAMVTGMETKVNSESGEVFYYYFAENSGSGKSRGKGVTGVFGGKLYYQGMAVGADGDDPYEVVYVPEMANRSREATGMFLVDREGNVKKGTKQKLNKKGQLTGGTKYKMDNGYTYRVCAPVQGKADYGYEIYRIEEDLENKNDPGSLMGEEDASYIYLSEVEE